MWAILREVLEKLKISGQRVGPATEGFRDENGYSIAHQSVGDLEEGEL